MKRLLPLLIFLMALPATAQEGTITYDRIVKIEMDLPPEMESMRDQFPTENKTRMLLHFNELESVWRASEEQEERGDREFRGGGMMVRMSRAREQNVTYVNHDEGRMIDRRDFMGRTFLIKDDQPMLAWKLTGEQSEFNGYMVQRATAVRDSSSVEAWFSPQIPVAVGPGPFAGLPGAILVLIIDDGQTTFTATDISLGELPEDAIVVPDEGREVSQEEFEAIMEEKRKEMEAQFGNRRGNGVRMIIRN
ncbi:MAG: GLPGLI family protein [Bacteroidota bacterium]|nr:GLPGLI family protein [Bacteroidota bacterium]